MNDFKSDYFESLTSFHKPIWIRKHEASTIFHVDESEQSRTNVFFSLEDRRIDEHSDMMEADEKFSFEHHETVDES
jgi:hypothetical protein